MIRETSAGAIIFKENGKREYLLLHYESGHWDFVKGSIEKGETEEETVKRETKEETGITKLELIKGFKETVQFYYKKGGELVFKEAIFHLAKSTQLSVSLSKEHIGYKWMNYQDALAQLTFKTAKDVLNKAEGFLKECDKQRKLSSY